MLILTIRTDKPEAEIGLFEDTTKLGYKEWPAHRQLAETIHQQMGQLLKEKGKDWADLKGIVAYHGPGSFTGLRIGLSVANALANSYGIPITGGTDSQWIEEGIGTLLEGTGSAVVLPEYGAPVHITSPKK